MEVMSALHNTLAQSALATPTQAAESLQLLVSCSYHSTQSLCLAVGSAGSTTALPAAAAASSTSGSKPLVGASVSSLAPSLKGAKGSNSHCTHYAAWKAAVNWGTSLRSVRPCACCAWADLAQRVCAALCEQVRLGAQPSNCIFSCARCDRFRLQPP